MNWDTFSDSTTVQHLGWTLAHSIWQLALIAGVLFIALRFIVRTSPNTRYLACILALTLSVIVPVVTFLQVSERVKQFGVEDALGPFDHSAFSFLQLRRKIAQIRDKPWTVCRHPKAILCDDHMTVTGRPGATADDGKLRLFDHALAHFRRNGFE